jgi:hypothetical protein
MGILLPADLVQRQTINVPARPPTGCDLAILASGAQLELEIDIGREPKISRTPGHIKKRQGHRAKGSEVDHGRRTKGTGKSNAPNTTTFYSTR